MKKIKVLSLFNGMNCIGLALHSLGVEFELYVSEIDKYANKVSNTLFPNTIELGDVTKIDINSLPAFDLVVGGSPCQGFSQAGNGKAFEHEESKLFFEFLRILKSCKEANPNLKWLLENVRPKKQEWAHRISLYMGIEPVIINSALLSAQNRLRYYWTNIGTSTANLFGIEEPGIKQPKDKGILLKDILELEVDEKFYMKLDKKLFPENNQNKASCFTAGGNSGGNHSDMDMIAIKCGAMRGRYKENGKRQDAKGSIAGKSKQEIEIRKDFKTNCLTSVQKDNILIVPEATKQGYAEIKDGDCVDLTFIDSKTRRGRKMEDKSNCLTAANYDFCQWKDAKIRRLTPKECMRLQTVPEWAIEKMLNCGVSDSQLYKMLGNGWTVAVIAYILGHEYK